MLTQKNWKNFLIYFLTGWLVLLFLFILTNLLLISKFEYLGQDVTGIFKTILIQEPFTVFVSTLKIFATIAIMLLGLQCLFQITSHLFRLVLGATFFFCTIIRSISIYPALSEKWLITSKYPSIKYLIAKISLLNENSPSRFIIQSAPFLFCCIIFVIFALMYLKKLRQIDLQVQKAKNSFHLDELERISKIFSIQGLSFIIFLVGGGFFISNLNPSLTNHVPQNNTHSSSPNVFIFAIDSLRFDRLSDPKYASVMPFLTSKLHEASLFKPMLVGIPRTFPSWVEIASGKYAINTGVKTMFPPKAATQGHKDTVGSILQQQGYSTLFVSDFAGDIFPRFPFGGDIVDTPNATLQSLIENGLITALPTLQAFLTQPKLHRYLPSLLESPEIADPRLVAKAFEKNLETFSSTPAPIFATMFFSSAHFPYASPAPWFAKFQKQNAPLAFQKLPDQTGLNFNPLIDNQPSFNKKEQTIALYNGGLSAIDSTLKQIFQELENKGWLENSIILVFGDHGENLYDGNLGMGHGDGLQGEFSNSTPLIIFTHGTGRPTRSEITNASFVRTIDIMPTILRRLSVNYDYTQLDGTSLLDVSHHKPRFAEDRAYQESGIWFNAFSLTPEGKKRIIYPGVTNLLEIDASKNLEFYIRPEYSNVVNDAKERAWIKGQYKLIARTEKSGTQLFLYERNDVLAKYDISNRKDMLVIKNQMQNEMNEFLKSHGVQILKNGPHSFFYSESIPQ